LGNGETFGKGPEGWGRIGLDNFPSDLVEIPIGIIGDVLTMIDKESPSDIIKDYIIACSRSDLMKRE
jgi:hypothetical protein